MAKKTHKNSETLGPNQSGLVIAHFRSKLAIERNDGKIIECKHRKQLTDLVAGDRVLWQAESDATGVVTALEPRTSLLARPDERGKLRPIAANVDQIIIVITSTPETPRYLLDSYLVAAEAVDIKPIILHHKSDLLTDDRESAETTLSIYQAIGYQTLFSSIEDKRGLEQLLILLKGHTSIFSGTSGVGKSSLINALIPEQDLSIGALSEAGLGSHTTTTTHLYHFPQGGNLIDSPGIREFGLWHMEPREIGWGFIEFREFIEKCKFRNCIHQSEPDCAVKAAVDNAQIHPDRLASYYELIRQR